MFDVLVVGGGAAGMSCTLVLGSAKSKPFAKDKHIGIVMHQRASHLQSALFNNVLGLAPGTTGASILEDGKMQLKQLYPHVEQIENEKVTSIIKTSEGFIVTTNANSNGQNANFVMGIPATFDQQNKGHDVLNVNDIKLNVPKE